MMFSKLKFSSDFHQNVIKTTKNRRSHKLWIKWLFENAREDNRNYFPSTRPSHSGLSGGKSVKKPQKIENPWKNEIFDKCKLQVIKGSNFMLENVGISPETRQLRSSRRGQMKFTFWKAQFLTCYRALESSKQICALMQQTSVV